MPKENDWKRIAIERIKENRQVTSYRGLDTSDLPYKEHPNYRVCQYSPDTELDGEQYYLISGTEAQLILQSSLLTALHDILGQRLGYGIDFEKWFADFELEFKFDPETGKNRIPVKSELEVLEFKYWGGSRDERPKFEWLDVPKDNRGNKRKEPLGYRVIRFWKNRKQTDDFYVLAGTPTELRSQIFYLMNGGGDVGSDNIGGKGISESRLLSGWPEIKIKFYQTKPIEGSKVRYDSEFGITLIGYGEAIEDNESRTLDLADLKRFKAKIEELFYPGGTAHVLERGLEIWTYQDWKKGYACWGKFRNETTALNLYQKIVQVKGDIFNPDTISQSEAYRKEKFNDSTEITVLSKKENKRNLRPIVELEFWQAWIWLPKSCQKIMLFSRSRRSPVDPRLL